MKWLKILGVTILFILMFSGCTSFKYLSNQQTESNFTSYMNDIAEQLTGKGRIINRTNPSIDEYGIYCTAQIILDDGDVSIAIDNETLGETGIERFEVIYSKELSSLNDAGTLDLETFTSIVNCISGKTLDLEFCRSFLDAPESDFSPQRYGLSKLERQLIFKMAFLNWLEDWSISYEITDDLTESLCFWGVTKNSCS